MIGIRVFDSSEVLLHCLPILLDDGDIAALEPGSPGHDYAGIAPPRRITGIGSAQPWSVNAVHRGSTCVPRRSPAYLRENAARSMLYDAVRQKTWASPVHPRRSSRCGQSVGTP